jgi:magnesium transporter
VIHAWRADQQGAREVTPEQAVAAALDGTAKSWIDFDCEDRDTLERIVAPLKIHPLAIEDMVSEINRPKYDDYGSYLYVVVHSARWEENDRPKLREIDLLVGEQFLVTYHDGETRSIAAAQDVLARRPDLLTRGPVYLLHFLLDVLVDQYLPLMDHLADEIDVLEQQVMRQGERLGERAVHVKILRLKRGMAALRRIVGPQRDTILALTRDEFHTIPADMRPYLRDVYDRLARVSDLLDSYRDEVAGLLDLHVSVVSYRLNQIIKVLTVIATLGLPLTVVTSYYGMNFPMAAYHWKFGELYVLSLLVVTVGGTWWFLKRRHWI